MCTVSIRVEPVLCVSEDACKGASSPSISSFIKLVLQENLSSLIRNPSFFAFVSLLRKTIGSVYPDGLVRTSKWRYLILPFSTDCPSFVEKNDFIPLRKDYVKQINTMISTGKLRSLPA